VKRHGRGRIFGDCICRWFVQMVPLLPMLGNDNSPVKLELLPLTGLGLFPLYFDFSSTDLAKTEHDTNKAVVI